MPNMPAGFRPMAFVEPQVTADGRPFVRNLNPNDQQEKITTAPSELSINTTYNRIHQVLDVLHIGITGKLLHGQLAARHITTTTLAFHIFGIACLGWAAAVRQWNGPTHTTHRMEAQAGLAISFSAAWRASYYQVLHSSSTYATVYGAALWAYSSYRCFTFKAPLDGVHSKTCIEQGWLKTTMKATDMSPTEGMKRALDPVGYDHELALKREAHANSVNAANREAEEKMFIIHERLRSAGIDVEEHTEPIEYVKTLAKNISF